MFYWLFSLILLRHYWYYAHWHYFRLTLFIDYVWHFSLIRHFLSDVIIVFRHFCWLFLFLFFFAIITLLHFLHFLHSFFIFIFHAIIIFFFFHFHIFVSFSAIFIFIVSFSFFFPFIRYYYAMLILMLFFFRFIIDIDMLSPLFLIITSYYLPFFFVTLLRWCCWLFIRLDTQYQ